MGDDGVIIAGYRDMENGGIWRWERDWVRIISA
jgi:hypothetical protein